MKKIFLNARIGKIIPTILEFTDWHINVLIVQNSKVKEQYINNKRISKIYTMSEFFELENVGNIDFLSYDKYRELFGLVDMGMRRIKGDYQYVKYQFFNGIATWEKLFQEYEVDFCLLESIQHGLTLDSVMFTVAKDKKIPCFILDDVEHMGFMFMFTHWGEKLLCIPKQFRESNSYELMKKGAYYNIYEAGKNGYGKIGSLLYKIGGESLILIACCLKNRSLYWRHDETQKYLPHYIEKLFNWRYIISENDRKFVSADYDKKFVVYFLHFEPEATVVHYTRYMESQLIIIKILAASLPKGWKLYVKEHPISRSLNRRGLSHFIEFYSAYNSRWFWNEIINTKNVVCIDIKESATTLIKKSEAVATIVGTVIMKSVIENKPCLIFGDRNKIIYSEIDGMYNISSTRNCKLALKEIFEHKWKGYKNVEEVLSKYIVENDIKGYRKFIRIIEDVYESHKV